MIVRADSLDEWENRARDGDAVAGPVAALRELQAHLERDAPMSDAAKELLIEAIDRWQSRECETLDRALRLTGRGGVPAAKAAKLAQRNRLLRRLWSIVPEWAELTPYAAAGVMSLSVERYITTRWPREKDSVTAPPGEPAATWWRILTLDVPIPKAKMLANILSE